MSKLNGLFDISEKPFNRLPTEFCRFVQKLRQIIYTKRNSLSLGFSIFVLLCCVLFLVLFFGSTYFFSYILNEQTEKARLQE